MIHIKIYLQKLKQSHGEPMEFEEVVNISDIVQLDNDIREITPVKVKGFAKLDGTEVMCDFTIKGEMILPCARTLVDVPYDFSIHVIENFSTSPYQQDDEVHVIDSEVLDLVPYIKENVLLETPFRVFASRDELEANTIEEGDGWTLITEEEQTKKVDPRLEKLKALLDDNSKDEDSKG
ncbi:YceD family protein [Gracilibacillus dipsosauri]|uniref:YceD family protein n=1 Tax=Gracilibacillus dipsosauri TaxID=178340 RepID=UPI000B115349